MKSAGDEIRGSNGLPQSARVDAEIQRMTSVVTAAGAVDCERSGGGISIKGPGGGLASPGRKHPVGGNFHARSSIKEARTDDATVVASRTAIHSTNEVSK